MLIQTKSWGTGTGWLSAQWTWPGSKVEHNHHSCPHMNDPREGQQRDKKGRTRGVGKQNDRQSIILVKMLSPHCTFTFHQVFWLHMSGKNAPRGSLQLTLMVHRSPPSSPHPSSHLSHVQTRPPQSKFNMNAKHHLGRKCALNRHLLCFLSFTQSYVRLCVMGHPDVRPFWRHVDELQWLMSSLIHLHSLWSQRQGPGSCNLTEVTEINSFAGHVQARHGVQSPLSTSVFYGFVAAGCGGRENAQA